MSSAHVSKLKKQRKRASLVCSSCKEKKIKCDRQKPCSNCIKSSAIRTCNYDYEVKRNEKNDIKIVEKDPANFDVNETKFHVFGLPEPAQQLLHDSPISGKNSIMDISFNLQTSYSVNRKPSRTLRGMQICSVYSKPEPFLSYNFLMSFREILKNEKKTWKSRNFKGNFQLHEIQFNDSNTANSVEGLNLLVEKLVCNNYYAVLERLGYFQTDLNKVLFGSYIPMGVVQLIFHHYFIMKREGIAFKRPVKNFEYAYIALITSLVELTNIFTKNNSSIFNFSLSLKDDEFNDLSVKLLNTSNYRRKCSIFAVYTILNLRLSLMIYGNALSAGVVSHNSYPMFQTAVNMCIEMGFSMNLDKVVFMDHYSTADSNDVNDVIFAKEIPVESLKTLWNYLLVLDASYFVGMSAAPYIDDRYHNGYYMLPNQNSDYFSAFVTTSREISLLFLTERKCTLRELLAGLSKVTKLISTLEPLDDYHQVEQNEEKWKLFYLKLQLLNLLSTLLYQVCRLLHNSNLSREFSQEVLNEPRNQKIIEGIKDECTTKIKILFFVVMNTILAISHSSFHYKFWLYNREVFSTWIGLQSLFFIDLIVTEESESAASRSTSNNSSKPVLTDDDKFSDPPIFKNTELENALFNFNPSKNQKFLNSVCVASQPERIVSFITGIYERVMQIPMILSDYTFFMKTKFFLIGIYFLYSYIKYHSEKGFEIYQYFDKLKTLTKRILAGQLQKGTSADLFPVQQILGGNLTENDLPKENDSTLRNSNQRESPSKPQNTLTGDQWDNNVLLSNSMIPSSQYDDIAASFFDDEGLGLVFKGIDEFFTRESSR